MLTNYLGTKTLFDLCSQQTKNFSKDVVLAKQEPCTGAYRTKLWYRCDFHSNRIHSKIKTRYGLFWLSWHRLYCCPRDELTKTHHTEDLGYLCMILYRKITNWDSTFQCFGNAEGTHRRDFSPRVCTYSTKDDQSFINQSHLLILPKCYHIGCNLFADNPTEGKQCTSSTIL